MRIATLAAVFGMAVVATTGCFAAKLPPKLTAEQTNQVRDAAVLPYRVAVDTREVVTRSQRVNGQWGPPYQDTIAASKYSTDRLVERIRKTGLFKEVGYAAALSGPPDLTATMTPVASPCNSLPVWTALTLGIIPTICQDEYGMGFTLRGAGVGDTLRVAYHGRGTAILGWLGGGMSLLPGWSRKPVNQTTRFDDHVAATFAAHASAIRRIAAPR
ncbi:MAG: hypothetical protein ABIR92_08225 [Gemmatimonadaceae bacterium]